jgi:hypothetical protein
MRAAQAARRTDALQSGSPPGKLRPLVRNGEAYQVGDRVVHLQVPGVFVVVGRRGAMLEVESDRGLRMNVHEVAVRRLEGPPPEPKDT